jgi:hypothetical protein
MRSFLAVNLGYDDGRGIAHHRSPLRTIALLPQLPSDSVPKSEQITESSSNRHFAVANCKGFYTLRAASAVPVKTQDLVCAICRLLWSLFLQRHAPGGAL